MSDAPNASQAAADLQSAVCAATGGSVDDVPSEAEHDDENRVDVYCGALHALSDHEKLSW